MSVDCNFSFYLSTCNPDYFNGFREQTDVFREQIDVFREHIDVFREHIDVFSEPIDVFREQIDVFREQIDVFREQNHSYSSNIDVISHFHLIDAFCMSLKHSNSISGG